MGIETGTALIIAAATTTGAVVYQTQRAKQEASKQRKEVEAQRSKQEEMFQRELEAGEYFEELRAEQMEMQSQSATIKTLSNLIEERRQPTAPQIVTLPAAKEYTPVEKINQAIDEFVRGL